MWFEGLPKPADKNYFIRYYGYLGTNPQDAVRTLLQDPLKPFREIGIGPMLNCAWQILSPWLGLPLFAFFLPNLRKNWTWLWALAFIPSAGLLFLSTTPALRDSSFHYMISLWPLLGVLTILVLSELKKPSLIWAWVLIAAMTQGKDAWVNANLAINDLYKYGFSDEAFRNFPPGTKIAADQRAGACIANEHQVVRWPELAFFGGQCPDVVLIHREHMATDLDHPCLVGTKLQRREEFGPWIKIWLHASDVK